MKESDALRVIDDHLDGQDDFPPEVTAELTEWLRDDPENADRAFQRVMLHVLLSRKMSDLEPPRRAGNGSDIVFIQTPASPQPSPRWMLLLGIVILIATAVSAITTSLVMLLPQHRADREELIKNHEGLVPPRVVQPDHRTSANVRWQAEAPGKTYSDWMRKQSWALASGIVEYRLLDSGRFVITGPAEFGKLDDASLLLTRGGCGVAWSPETDQDVWSLRTNNVVLSLDKTTRFALHTSAEIGTVLSVLKGELSFRQSAESQSAEVHSLLAGQAVWIERDKVVLAESDWVERTLGRVHAALNASFPRPLDAPLVYEGFDYPETLPTSAEFTHAGISLEHGGWGWRTCWQEHGSLASSIDHAPLRRRSSEDRRGPESLSFRDQNGYLLRTSGGQLRTSYGQTSRTERAIDPLAWPEEARDSRGVGADGSVVWLSFLAQSFNEAGGARYAFLRVGDEETGIRLGRLPGPDTSLWSAEVDRTHGEYEGPYMSLIPAGEPALFVARIEFQAGPEMVRVWLNPNLSKSPDDSQADLEFTAPDLRLDRIRIEGRYSTDFDEIRLGPSFASVSSYLTE